MVTLRMRVRLLGSIALCIALAAPAAWSGESPDGLGYRGLNSSGVYPASGLLKSWPEGGPELLWKYALGPGYSSVCVSGGKVYATGGETHALYVFTLDGKLERHVRLGSSSWKRFSGTRSTPLVAEGVALSTTPDATFYAVDLATGAVRWNLNAWKDFGSGKGEMGWGYPESPVLHKGKVIFNACSRDDQTPPVAAIDIRTGKKVWEVDPGSGKRYSAGDVSCALVRHKGRDIVLAPTWRYLLCLDADTGKRLWEIPESPSGSEKAITPIYSDGYVLWDQGGKARMLKLADDAESYTTMWTRTSLGDRFSHGVILDKRVYAFGNSAGRSVRTAAPPGAHAPAGDSKRGEGEECRMDEQDAAPPAKGVFSLLCLDAETGRLIHSRPAATAGHIAAADGMVYVVELVMTGNEVVSGNTNRVLRPRITLVRPTKDGFEDAGQFVPALTDLEVGVRDVEWQASVCPVIAEGCLFFRYGPLQVYELREERTAAIRERRARVKRVCERLRGPDTSAVVAALRELEGMGADLRFAVSDAAPLLTHPDVQARKGAADVLAGAGPAAASLLVMAMTNETVWGEGLAGAALMRALGTNDPVAALVIAAENDSGLRAYAKPLLVRCGDRPVPHLVRVMAACDKYTRWWVIDVLRSMGPDARGSVRALADVTRTQDQWFREHAANALAAIGRPAKPALPALIELLGHPYNRARAAAARAIASTGDNSETTLEALRKTAADSDDAVAAAATEALKALGAPPPAAPAASGGTER